MPTHNESSSYAKERLRKFMIRRHNDKMKDSDCKMIIRELETWLDPRDQVIGITKNIFKRRLTD